MQRLCDDRGRVHRLLQIGIVGNELRSRTVRADQLSVHRLLQIGIVGNPPALRVPIPLSGSSPCVHRLLQIGIVGNCFCFKSSLLSANSSFTDYFKSEQLETLLNFTISCNQLCGSPITSNRNSWKRIGRTLHKILGCECSPITSNRNSWKLPCPHPCKGMVVPCPYQVHRLLRQFKSEQLETINKREERRGKREGKQKKKAIG